MNSRKIIRTASCLAAAVAVIWLAGFLVFVGFVSTLAPPQDKVHTEAIIVLTGGPHRINAGLDLLSAGLASNLFISGVDARVTPETLVTMWRNQDGGEIPCCIVLGHQAQNTKQNADEARTWARENNVKSIRLVTSEYHMPRAWLEFRFAMPDITVIRHPVSSDTKPTVFWRLGFAEYHKILLTCLHHLLSIDD